MVLGSLSLSNTNEQKTLWVIDNSLSMAVTDVMSQDDIIISRLDLAKKIILSGSHMLSWNQAVMSVAHGAKLELPMNDNQSIMSDVVGWISVIMQGGGSNFFTPLQMIHLIYGDQPNLNIIWLTDGEFSDSGSVYTGSTDYLNITFIGVGSRVGWPILMGYNNEGVPRYKESSGVRVNSIRDDASLSRVAQYLDARTYFLDTDRSIDYSQIIPPIKNSSHISWYTILGAILICIWLVIPRYRYIIKNPTWK